ncbi:MAG: DUF3696 domain-containing protein [Deltaproteobacteria bacterium]|nr:DUF3696 domain-containing protein [Deltaproteobacteria bacterium]
MLTQIAIKNFKCFDTLMLPLAPLTLMTGFNAAGKSTTLQSILLIAQSLRSGNRSTELLLNGPLTHLGSPGEVIHPEHGDIAFAFEDDRAEVEWTFKTEDRSRRMALLISQVLINDQANRLQFSNLSDLYMLLPPEAPETARQLVNDLSQTIFISAVRMGTADVFPAPEDPISVHADVGVQGGFAPWWFQQFLDDDVDKPRCHPADSATSLRRQFNAWANELFPAAEGNALSIDKTNLMRLELRIGEAGEWRRPSNIGYGLTYAFPIIVAGLLAKPGQILIIDSPEAHLHPLGQSKMGRFLAYIAAAGVQVLIETHSDHILNGIRLAVRDQVIDPRKVAVYFFGHAVDAVAGPAGVVSPELDAQGNLSEWPEGFFDQTEKDLARLAGWE